MSSCVITGAFFVITGVSFMEGSPALYLGRPVSKENFRAFIYAPDGRQRLVESWDEFEANMQSGVWFATRNDAIVSKQSAPKPKTRQKKAKEPVGVLSEVDELLKEECDEHVPDDLAFEVTDDFLPKD
jgi:hypothetical protein